MIRLAALRIKNQLAQCQYYTPGKEYLCKRPVIRFYFPEREGIIPIIFCEHHIRRTWWIGIGPLYFAIKRIRR